MHFLTSLMILSGFASVFCLGLVKVIWDLSEMSVHKSPQMLSTQCGRSSGTEEEHSNANAEYELSPVEMGETE